MKADPESQGICVHVCVVFVAGHICIDGQGSLGISDFWFCKQLRAQMFEVLDTLIFTMIVFFLRLKKNSMFDLVF